MIEMNLYDSVFVDALIERIVDTNNHKDLKELLKLIVRTLETMNREMKLLKGMEPRVVKLETKNELDRLFK
jgi:hypothetical protein